MARLKELYNEKIRAELIKENKISNPSGAPVFTKIIVNSGVGEATSNSSAIEEMVEIISQITGQKPVVSQSRMAVSSFKLRKGVDIGVHVTLRGEMMWEFFDRLVNVVLPRTKDFRGLSPDSFDGNGNYSFGIEDHVVFPEIDTSKVQKIRSLQITIVTDTGNDDLAKKLMDKFDFPFRKDGKEV